MEFARLLGPSLGLVLLAPVLGCREDTESPTAPALEVSAAAARCRSRR
jgi:hypothetical protein